MKKDIFYTLIALIIFSSCSNKRYAHLPKVKVGEKQAQTLPKIKNKPTKNYPLLLSDTASRATVSQTVHPSIQADVVTKLSLQPKLPCKPLKPNTRAVRTENDIVTDTAKQKLSPPETDEEIELEKARQKVAWQRVVNTLVDIGIVLLKLIIIGAIVFLLVAAGEAGWAIGVAGLLLAIIIGLVVFIYLLFDAFIKALMGGGR